MPAGKGRGQGSNLSLSLEEGLRRVWPLRMIHDEYLSIFGSYISFHALRISKTAKLITTAGSVGTFGINNE